VEKMTFNQAWNEERQPRKKERGMHQLKEVDMLSAKVDLLMKSLEDKPLRRRKSCNSSNLTWPMKSVETLDTQGVNALSWRRTWTTSTTTTNIVPSRIKDGLSREPTTQVTIKVIIKVIILPIISHL
jgi:hypothetical protein